MRILVKKMPKSLNNTKVNKYMSDMGTTAFCKKNCKRQKAAEKQEELSAREENIPGEYRKESILLNS